MKAAERIPGAEIRTYHCSHFEPYLDPHFDGVVGDQIDFLTRTLTPPRRDDRSGAAHHGNAGTDAPIGGTGVNPLRQ